MVRRSLLAGGVLVDELELLVGSDGPQVCGAHGLCLVTDFTDTVRRSRGRGNGEWEEM